MDVEALVSGAIYVNERCMALWSASSTTYLMRLNWVCPGVSVLMGSTVSPGFFPVGYEPSFLRVPKDVKQQPFCEPFPVSVSELDAVIATGWISCNFFPLQRTRVSDP